jgi:hypothetical protein
MWIIASLPLWIIGAGFLALGALGTFLFFAEKDIGESRAIATGTFVSLLGAATFLALAAKVAS